MLPAPSWKSVMGGLNDHFGQNATVDAATKQTLEAWLVKNAGGPLPKPTLRITTTNWWVREHDELCALGLRTKVHHQRGELCGLSYAGE
jgi:hypothetical protein